MPGELPEEEVAQRLAVELFLKLAVTGDRDRPPLLGHEDGEGVGLFRHADRGPVPSAEALRQALLEREGEEARGAGDAVPGNDHGAVMHVTLSELAARLDSAKFRQVHRSHIVNLDAVEHLQPYDDRRLAIRLRDGTVVVASRAASEELRRLAR